MTNFIHDMHSSSSKLTLSALLVAVLVPTGCAVTEDDLNSEEVLDEGRSVLPPHEELLAQQPDSAPPTAAATGWTWTYSAVVGSETYRLNKNGDTRGICTFNNNITLKDTAGDGLGQRVYWRVSGASTWHVCDHEGGKGTQRTCDVTNDKFIQYQFCMKNGNTIVACAPVDGAHS